MAREPCTVPEASNATHDDNGVAVELSPSASLACRELFIMDCWYAAFCGTAACTAIPNTVHAAGPEKCHVAVATSMCYQAGA
jgi:hypothetical protein